MALAITGVGGNSGIVQRVGGELSPAGAFKARLTGTYTPTELAAFDTFFNGLASDGLYSLFDVLHLCCLDNASDSRLNLLSTSYTATSLTGFTARSGVASGEIRSGWGASNGVNFSSDFNHSGVYLASYGNGRNTNLVSASNNANTMRTYLETNLQSLSREITNLTNSDSAVAGLSAADYPGTYINSRNGTLIYAHAGNISFFQTRARNFSAADVVGNLRSIVSIPGNRVTALYAGAYISAAQSAQLEARFKTLFTALGVPYS
jgi:hypothetical protein